LRRPKIGWRGIDSLHSVDDARAAAQRRLPRVIFDFVDGGAETELSLRRNREAFSGVELMPRVLRGVGEVDLRADLLGTSSALPLALCPTGATRAIFAKGEPEVATAAASAGIPYSLSVAGTSTIEEVATASSGPLWFQLYTAKDRGWCRTLIEAARSAGYVALIVTVDTAASGVRERDLRNGLRMPLAIGPTALLEGLRRPRWAAQFLRGDPLRLAYMAEFTDLEKARLGGRLEWEDLEWIADAWGGPISLKGLLSPEDAKIAATSGFVNAVIVSSHGGRQLDGVPAPFEVLPEIVDIVEGRIQVLMDSGVRRGTDIVKALCCGASGCMIGRPYLYGLAVGGASGVRRIIQLLENELRRTLILMGVQSIAMLDRSYLRRRTEGIEA
jgi:L-lactate dehydrogenase (cytochrome)